MEAKIIEVAEAAARKQFEKLADEVEERVSRKYETRLQKLERSNLEYEIRLQKLNQKICQLEQELTRTSRQNDDIRGQKKKIIISISMQQPPNDICITQ